MQAWSLGNEKSIIQGLALKHANSQVKSRHVLNWIPILLALFIPWFLFMTIYYIMSFRTHYNNPTLAVLSVVFGLLLSFLIFRRGWRAERTNRDFVWYYYVAIACLIASLVGGIGGDINFWFNMKIYYSVEHMASYINVNPSTLTYPDGRVMPMVGARYQDAGKVYFKHGAKLDRSKAQSFKSHNNYCVAPIVDSACEKNCGYDFWAVGLNCCGEESIDFRCGEYLNDQARAGLRMVHDDQRPYFRLAVLEAEGVHGISSTHPLFFYILHDPVKENNSFKANGYSNYLVGVYSFFAVNFCVLILICYWLSSPRGSELSIQY